MKTSLRSLPSVSRRAMLGMILFFNLALVTIGHSRARYDALLFEVPAGWTHEVHTREVVLISTDRTVTIAIARSRPADPGLNAISAEIKAEVSRRPGFHSDRPPQYNPHVRSGGESLTFEFTYADPRHPGQVASEEVILLAAGGRCTTITLRSANSGGIERNREAIVQCLGRLQMISAINVEPGDPPLTRYLLDEATHLYQWTLRTYLTQEQEELLHREIRALWKKGDRQGMEPILKIPGQWDALNAMTPDQQAAERSKYLDAISAAGRAETASAVAKMLVGIYDDTQHPLAVGNPPLTRQAVEAYAEMLCFAASQATGERLSMQPGLRDAFTASISQDLARQSDAKREKFAKMPAVWAAFRKNWGDLPVTKKQSLIAAWKQDSRIVALGQELRGDPLAGTQVASTAEVHGGSTAGVHPRSKPGVRGRSTAGAPAEVAGGAQAASTTESPAESTTAAAATPTAESPAASAAVVAAKSTADAPANSSANLPLAARLRVQAVSFLESALTSQQTSKSVTRDQVKQTVTDFLLGEANRELADWETKQEKKGH